MKEPKVPAHLQFLFEELGVSDMLARCAGQCNFRAYLFMSQHVPSCNFDSILITLNPISLRIKSLSSAVGTRLRWQTEK